MRENPRIVFFDGICNLCNSSVDFLMKIDKRNMLRFASLQGNTASAVLTDLQPNELNTIIYLTTKGRFEKSSAVLQILNDIGGFWRIFAIFKIIPKPLLDKVYVWVSKNRYHWFGKRNTCRMPIEKERSRFLD